MTFAIKRREALKLSLGGLMTGLGLSVGPVRAGGTVSAFAQALAAAAQDHAGLAQWYRARDYAPLWTGPTDGPRRLNLLAAFDTAPFHGLPVPRYDAAALREACAEAATEGDVGRLEFALSLAFLRFVRDLSSGALEPHELEPGIKRHIARPDPALILAAAEGTGFDRFLAGLVPHAPEYARLMKAKIALEAVVAAGGFGAEVPAEAMEPGDSGARVVALRNRLIALGYLDRAISADYDAVLAEAVQRFQLDHGIGADGRAGERTIAALNVDADRRLRAVVVAMERLRWMGNAPRGARHIWVNQPEFVARVIDEGQVTFRTRVVIGKVGTETESPEFSDMMRFMVVNPSWSVPRSIAVKEYLPMFQKDPTSEGQLQLIDDAGRVVSRETVDFAAFTPGNFPFDLRQPPMDGNALGKVKFMFPNSHNIYLHDTPSKSLFAKEVRAFSHGCIRVSQPFDLAYTLLSRQSDDPKGLFATHLNTGRETTLDLATPIPVHLVYFTAWPTEGGRIAFLSDVYGRDGRLAEALAQAGVALPLVQG